MMQTSLYTAETTGAYKVASVPEIGLLKNLGIREGTRVSITQRYAFGGPLLLNIEDSFFVAVGKDVATQITVGRIS
ncbi:MAG: ferrous iron transport protein A [Defluviitaleaceae bacterium]|nr:ferrous iron transport protein A [Defluviitaleaceae bacterium]MCL2262913.1 ferrous iron transport protein A [Defluviitaleaceae bacterium]